MNKNKLFLTTIAKNKKLLPEDVLAALVSSNIIYALVEHVTLTTVIDNMNFDAIIYKEPECVTIGENITLNPGLSMDFAITDLPINDMYLDIILSKGTWEGDIIQLCSFDEKSKKYNYTKALFTKTIRLSVKDLFVYENDFTDFESKNTCIWKTETSLSSREENSFHALIGVFLDMMVDKKDKNILTNPNDDKKYPFKNQAELINYIVNYDINGLKSSSLEDKFSKANAILNEKLNR